MTPLERIVAALDSRGCRPKQRGSQWYARCPAHDGDDFDSLSATEGVDGRALMTCHSQGCSFSEIMRSLGLGTGDAFTETIEFNGRSVPIRNPNRSELPDPSDVYQYTDENGELLFEVLRYVTPKGKTFRQRQPDGDGWNWRLDGVRKPLYRLPSVLDAIAKDKPVYLVEGEKDVHALEALGFTATCAPGGACERDRSWSDDWTRSLAGARVVILPDNDDVGAKHARIAQESLMNDSRSVKVVELPGLGPKGDASDWIACGGTATELLELTQKIYYNVDTLDTLLTAKLPQKPNLIGEWFKATDLVMVYAARGVGKTQFLIGLTLALEHATPFLGRPTHSAQQVLYLDGEMPGVTMRDRFRAQSLGLPLSPERIPAMIITPDRQDGPVLRLSTPDGVGALMETLDRYPAISVVIMDNLACLYGGAENDAEAWDRMQGLLLDLRRRGIAAVVAHHAGKSGQQRGTSHREDTLDTVIKLSHPSGYDPRDGAKFEVEFEKARNVTTGLPHVELTLTNVDPDPAVAWAVKSLEDTRDKRIAEMMGDGMSQRDIAAEIGCSQSTIAKRWKAIKARGGAK